MSSIMSLDAGHGQSGSPFDQIKQTRPDGTEFWSARDLQPLMGYTRWQTFEVPIERAIQAASNTGMDVTSNFTRSRKVLGSRGPGQDDYQLSRQAAYLVAMNGDPNKPEVANAQAYFAERTDQAETFETKLAGMSDWVRQQMDTLIRIGEIEAEQKRQDAEIQQVTARVDSLEGNHDWWAALGYASLHELPTDRVYLQRVGSAASRILRATDATPGKTQHPAYGQVNTYPAWVLEQAFSEVPAHA